MLIYVYVYTATKASLQLSVIRSVACVCTYLDHYNLTMQIPNARLKNGLIPVGKLFSSPQPPTPAIPTDTATPKLIP